MSVFRTLLGTFAIVSVLVFAYLFISTRTGVPAAKPSTQKASLSTQALTASATQPSIATATKATSTPAKTVVPKPVEQTPTPSTAPAQRPAKPAVAATNTPNTAQQSHNSSSDSVQRLENPYDTPPLSFAQVNQGARDALVNILCIPHSGSLHPISGSGVLIDPRGIILTNAHVAQFVLLSESPTVDLTCSVRTGSPAVARYRPAVLYMPSVWVHEHYKDITVLHPTGTGEHDYALLSIQGTLNGSPLPSSFPYLSPDTREGVAFQNDKVLVASYPAEFLGGISAEFHLYPASSLTTIGQLLTFKSGTIDVLSLGGIIEAQSGSSGGIVANAWARLVGLIVTTSEGDTTGQRDLRALSLSYINRDLLAQDHKSLASILAGDTGVETSDFTENQAPALLDLYLQLLTN